jgi:hypothetical protein
MKVSLENVEAILLERQIEQPKVQAILRDLEKAAEEEKAESEATKAPKNKWEHIIILNDPEKKLNPDELTGWVVVQEEGSDAGTILSRLSDAAKEQNESAKRKKSLLENFGAVFQSLKSKFLKNRHLKIKTKEAVRVLTVNGKSL